MKHKLSKILGVGLTLALLTSLLLTAAPVSAAVSQPVVTFATDADRAPDPKSAVYTIKFTTNVDLEIGDGIVIEFPEGTTGLASIDVGSEITGVDEASVADEGERLSITLGAPLEAGVITLGLGDGSAGVTNPPDGDYALKVYTSKEQTAVTSETYMISKALPEPTVATLVPDTVATQADYEITFTTSGDLRASDAIVIEFPEDTDISAVVKEDVAVLDFNPSSVTVDSISIVEQVLTITLGGALVAGVTEVTVANKIINPTTVLNPDPLDGDTGGEWRLIVYTSYLDRIPVRSNAYTIGGTVGTDVSQIAWLTVDEYIPNDTAPADVDSIKFVIETRDVYGNPAEVGGSAVTFDLTASSGAFYSAATALPAALITTIDIGSGLTDSGVNDLFYKGATAGTVTITADEVDSQGWTAAETTIIVNPMLELWGGGQLKGSYATFDLAMAVALPYDTIKVAPSTYDGGITVSKPYLTLESTNGAPTTFIDATNGGIVISAAGVTVDGFTVKNVQTNTQAIDVTGNDATVKYNVITLADSESYADGIQIGNGVDGATVEYNELAQEVTIMVTVSSNVELSHNTFGGGINLVNSTNIDIIDNDLIGVHSIGIRFGNGPFTNILIEGNTISGTTATTNPKDAGIGFLSGGSATVTGLTIRYNDIIDNLGPGIVIPSTLTTFTNVVIMYNDISGNVGYGINSAVAVTAQYNWWGDVTGPSTDPGLDSDVTPTAYGEGDPISDNVTYAPWLADSQAILVPATSSRYAIEIPLTNVASYSAGTWSGGWNTFSTPISLHGDGDTWGDIVALINLDAAMVYGWDGTNWIVPFPSTTVITPLDAIFVQMKVEARLPILFSTQLLPAATKDLSAGWNLIGLGNLETMYRDDALASLGTGDTAKYSHVIDPISGAIITATEDNTGEMLPGMGYWIFMKEAATLAGFSVTPQPWID